MVKNISYLIESFFDTAKEIESNTIDISGTISNYFEQQYKEILDTILQIDNNSSPEATTSWCSRFFKIDNFTYCSYFTDIETNINEILLNPEHSTKELTVEFDKRNYNIIKNLYIHHPYVCGMRDNLLIINPYELIAILYNKFNITIENIIYDIPSKYEITNIELTYTTTRKIEKMLTDNIYKRTKLHFTTQNPKNISTELHKLSIDSLKSAWDFFDHLSKIFKQLIICTEYIRINNMFDEKIQRDLILNYERYNEDSVYELIKYNAKKE